MSEWKASVDPHATPIVGRERDLAVLQSIWAGVREGPQFVVIRGETGTGKTALVHAFYAWLAASAPTPHYWPLELGRVGASLRYNPPFASADSSEADTREAEIPWLWLGIRFYDDRERNQSAGLQLGQALDELRPHVRPLLQHRLRRQLVKSTLLEVTGSLLGGIPDAVLSVMALVGNLRAEREQSAAGAVPIAAAAERQRVELSDQLRDFLRAVLDPDTRGMQHVPVIVLLDDAQWIDDYTLQMLEKLWHEAHSKRWPLLVLATHWEREWNEHVLAVAGGDVPLHSLPAFVARNRDQLGGWAPFDLPALEAMPLAALTGRGLPGLTPPQRAAIAGWVGGNPQLLEDLVQLLRTNTRWFVDRDPAKALTADGERRFQSLLGRTTHHSLVRRRFDRLAEPMRDMLAVASAQGLRFVRAIAAEAGRRIDGLEPDHALELLSQAQNPFAVVGSLSDNAMEFRHRAMFEIARERFRENYDNIQRGEFDRHFRDILAEWLLAEPAPEFDAIAQAELLQIAMEQFPGDDPSVAGLRLRAVLRAMEWYESRALYRLSVQCAKEVVKLTESVARNSLPLRASFTLSTELQAATKILLRAELFDEAVQHARLLDQHAESLFASAYVRLNAQAPILSTLALAAERTKDFAEALRLADRHLAVSSELKTLLVEQGTWSDALDRAEVRVRAMLCGNRFRALERLGRFGEAQAARLEEIQRLEDLRARCQPEGTWTADDATLLSMACVVGSTVADPSLSAADVLADFDANIARHEGSGRPSADSLMALTTLHLTRGELQRSVLGPAAAVEGFACALGAVQALRARVGSLAEWSPFAEFLAARVHWRYGASLAESGELHRAIVAFDDALAAISALNAVLGSDIQPLTDYGCLKPEIHCSRGDAQLRLNDPGAAVADYERARDGFIAALARRPPVAPQVQLEARQHLPIVWDKLALTYAAWSKPVEALHCADEAVRCVEALREESLRAAQWYPGHEHSRAVAYSNRAWRRRAVDSRDAGALEDAATARAILDALDARPDLDPSIRSAGELQRKKLLT